jgi:hypothetical protein
VLIGMKKSRYPRKGAAPLEEKTAWGTDKSGIA